MVSTEKWGFDEVRSNVFGVFGKYYISFVVFHNFSNISLQVLWCEKVFWSLSTLQLFCNLDYYLTSTFSKINGATCYYVKLNQHKTFLIKNASSHSVEIAEIYSYLFSKKLREINLLSIILHWMMFSRNIFTNESNFLASPHCA